MQILFFKKPYPLSTQNTRVPLSLSSRNPSHSKKVCSAVVVRFQRLSVRLQRLSVRFHRRVPPLRMPHVRRFKVLRPLHSIFPKSLSASRYCVPVISTSPTSASRSLLQNPSSTKLRLGFYFPKTYNNFIILHYINSDGMIGNNR